MGSRSIGGTAPTTLCGLIENEWMKLDVVHSRSYYSIRSSWSYQVLSASHMQSDQIREGQSRSELII